MWRRALLAAAAVSYLICVLIMSGLQKEDLDVSMLAKLKRYNVNIDDINNEQIRQQCTLTNNGFTKHEQKENKEDRVSTTEYDATINTKDPIPSVNLNMDTVTKLLKTRENPVKNLDALTTIKTITHQEMVTRVNELDNEPKINVDLLRRFFEVETQKKSSYKIDGNFKTSKQDTTINIKTNQTGFSNDVTNIDKLIKDYLIKKQQISTTTEHTTRFTIDIQKIYKQIDDIIANSSNTDNEKGKIVPKYPKKAEKSNVKDDINAVPVMPLTLKTPYPAGKQLFESFYNFINEISQFRNDSYRPYLNYVDNVHSKDSQPNKSLDGPNLKHSDNDKETTTFKSTFVKDPETNTLTPSLVKEIAETVKNVIMKDLRKELARIYLKINQTTTEMTSTIRTTTETLPTTTLKSMVNETNLAIMDKFMELYEQIKSLKQATYVLKVTNESTNFISKLKNPHIPPRKTPIMPAEKRLQIQEPNLFISPIINYNTKPLFNHNSYPPKRDINRLPITIQTNSVEIQPLAVPVSKPDSMIRQNIVVHTINRYRPRDRNNYKHFNSRTDSDGQLDYKNRTYNYIPLKRYDGYNSARYANKLQEPKPREDVIRFRVRDNGNSRLDTDYYEKINFENNNGGNEKHGIFNDRKYPRFHERLERVDPASDGIPVIPDVDIKDKTEQNSDFPSRHQLSLVDMKRGASYDDSHFKNFLKTQQKVTDVLERILAIRPKTNTPRSVETV